MGLWIRNGAILAMAGGLTQQLTRGYVSPTELLGNAIAGAFFGGILWRVMRRKA